MANTWEWWVGDLYPPMPLLLSDTNGPVNIATASVSAITLYAKGTSGTINSACNNMQVSFTGTLTQGSNQITGVTSTAGLWVPDTEPWPSGSTLFSSGYLPAPTGSVGNWALPTIQSITGAGPYTLTLGGSYTALASGSVAIIANMGTAQYSPASLDTSTAGTYKGVVQVTWTAGSKIQTFPSDPTGEYTITINPLPS